MALPSKYSVGLPVEVIASGGHPVRQVDTSGTALDDATYSYSVAMPVMPVDSNGVNEDSSLVFSTHLKVTLSSQGLPVVRIDTAGNTVNTSLGTGGGLTLLISSPPTLAGAAVVGQTLYATQGTYNATPDSVTPTWTVGGVVNADATGDALLILDSYQGLVIGYSEVAHKAGYTDSPSNAATSTGAVAAIDLTNAITAFTRTSASGVTPMQWSLSFASNVYAGYQLRMETFSEGTLLDAAHRTQDFNYQLTNDDLQSGANLHAALTAAGWVEPGATEFLRPTVYTTSPNGLGYEYVGPVITPTDTATAMAWSTTDKFDQGAGSLTYSNSNLTLTCQSGNPYSVRGSRAVAYDLTYWEITGGANNAGVADPSQPLSVIPGSTADGNTASTDAGVYQGKYGTGDISYNGSLTAVGTWSNTDTIQFALDRVNKKIWFGKNNTWLNGTPNVSGGLAMASIGTMYPFVQLGFNNTTTANFGTTPGGTAGFTYTPPTGFVAP